MESFFKYLLYRNLYKIINKLTRKLTKLIIGIAALGTSGIYLQKENIKPKQVIQMAKEFIFQAKNTLNHKRSIK